MKSSREPVLGRIGTCIGPPTGIRAKYILACEEILGQVILRHFVPDILGSLKYGITTKIHQYYWITFLLQSKTLTYNIIKCEF